MERPPISRVGSLLLFFSALFILTLVVSTPAATMATGDREAVLKFRTGRHVLGFGANSMLVAGGDHLLRLEFAGARAAARPVAATTAATGPTVEALTVLETVLYDNLWPGVDLTIGATERGLAKSTYRIAPGANPAQIRLRSNAHLGVDDEGRLHYRLPAGTLVESAPVAWQTMGRKRVPVDVAWAVQGETARFRLGPYDPAHPLVIDPILSLEWHTFLGSDNADAAYDIATDDSGNVYVAGYSSGAWGTPKNSHSGSRDILVAKLDGRGALLWNTFLGSSTSDTGRGIAVDGNGNVYVTGYSDAGWGTGPLSPHTGPDLNDDIVVARLDGGGNLLWHTFLGSSGTDRGWDIDADGANNVCIAGYSTSLWGNPVNGYSGGTDAAIICLNPDGSLKWHTFLASENDDYGYGLVATAGGDVYVAGRSHAAWGTPRRPFTGVVDAFVAHLNGDGTLSWNTFLGGEGVDLGTHVALHDEGHLFVTGYSDAAWGDPARQFSANSDGFVARLDSNGYLSWNTFLGGTAADEAWGVATGNSGLLYVAGFSSATWGSPERHYSGTVDAFAAALDGSSGALRANTFLGSNAGDTAYKVALGESVYLAGRSGGDWGAPVHSYTGNDDVLVAQLVALEYLVRAIPGESTAVGSGGGLVPFQVELVNNSNAATTMYAQLDMAHDTEPVSWITTVRAFEVPANDRLLLDLGFNFYATDLEGAYTLTALGGTDPQNLNLADSFGLSKNSTRAPDPAASQEAARFVEMDSGELWELESGPTAVKLQRENGRQSPVLVPLLLLPLLAAFSLLVVRPRPRQ